MHEIFRAQTPVDPNTAGNERQRRIELVVESAPEPGGGTRFFARIDYLSDWTPVRAHRTIVELDIDRLVIALKHYHPKELLLTTNEIINGEANGRFKHVAKELATQWFAHVEAFAAWVASQKVAVRE